jgi:hypothetical protein
MLRGDTTLPLMTLSAIASTARLGAGVTLKILQKPQIVRIIVVQQNLRHDNDLDYIVVLRGNYNCYDCMHGIFSK